MAFQNADDQSKVLIVRNDGAEPARFVVKDGVVGGSYTLPGGAVATFGRYCSLACYGWPTTRTGVLLFVVEPLPNWPEELAPQQYATPPVVRPQLCA